MLNRMHTLKLKPMRFPLIILLQKIVIISEYVQVDKTTVQVLNEVGYAPFL